ncbi:hypothetical protein C0992_008265, partial [Termitomyces sp. T32_za158]
CDDIHEAHDFVQADKRIDLEGKDQPLHRFQEIAEQQIEIQAMQACELRCNAQTTEDLPIGDVSSRDDDLTVGQALNSAAPAAVTVDTGDVQLHRRIQQGYAADTFFVKILDKPKEHLHFYIEHQLIYMMSTS